MHSIQVLTYRDVRRSSVLQLVLISHCTQCFLHFIFSSNIWFFGSFFFLFSPFTHSTFLSLYYCIPSFVWLVFFVNSFPFLCLSLVTSFPYIRLLLSCFLFLYVILSHSFCQFLKFYSFVVCLCIFLLSFHSPFHLLAFYWQ